MLAGASVLTMVGAPISLRQGWYRGLGQRARRAAK